MTDLARSIKTAVESGEVWLGVRRVRKALRAGKARMVIVASNPPDERLLTMVIKDVKVVRFAGTAADLGAACGKPFGVSALAVISPGSSSILSAA